MNNNGYTHKILNALKQGPFDKTTKSQLLMNMTETEEGNKRNRNSTAYHISGHASSN